MHRKSVMDVILPIGVCERRLALQEETTMGSARHPAIHDAAAKKAMDARLARVEGQVRGVRRMIAEDRPCEDIALQLAAARKALDRAFYEMISCLIRSRAPGGANERTERAGKVAELLARFG